ncbi:MAG: non-homologous end-joining DNA ligase LigD, partial [Candidatus Limnocylindrales bacterium]
MPDPSEVVEAGGRQVTITNPDKVYFAGPGYTKRDLVTYYLAVAEGALRGVRDRPMALKRYVDGAAG